MWRDRPVWFTHAARVAIDAALQAWGVGAGDEVLAPAYNCGSEIDVLSHRGVTMQLYDAGRDGMIDVSVLERMATPHTKVLYITHYFGWPQPVREIQAWAQSRRIRLLEDCALALLSSDGGTPVGTVADAAVFNLPKFLPLPDGGALVMQDSDRAQVSMEFRSPSSSRVLRKSLPLIKRAGLHAADWAGWRRTTGRAVVPGFDATDVDDLPHKRGIAHRPDMPPSYYFDPRLARTGLSWTSRLILASLHPDSIIAARRRNYVQLAGLLRDIRGVHLLHRDLPEGVCPVGLPLIVTNRDRICRKLNSASIDAFPWWAGFHRAINWSEYPEACFLKDNVLLLPVHQDLGPAHMQYIAECVRALTADMSGGAPCTQLQPKSRLA